MAHHHLFTRETELQVLERLVREAETDIACQRRIIEELRRDGRAAIGATTLLRLFEREMNDYRRKRETLQVKHLSFSDANGGVG